MRSRTLLLGALLATVALLGACSADPPPLISGGWAGHDCGPSKLGQTMIDGTFILYNNSSSPVTVTSVRLRAPNGVTMTQAWLIPQYKPPHGSLSYIGDGYPYPPVTWPTWKDRQAIPGADIKPHQALNLFFGITRTADRRVEASPPVVTYTSGGNTYILHTGWGFVLLAPQSHCPAS